MNPARILIVEDDDTLRRVITDQLEAEGWELRAEADGRGGYEAAMSKWADLILLDLMLPEIDGYEICRSMRLEKIETPILMLTAKGQTDDVVRGLELGADDYMVKPFALRELTARVRALLRRHETPAEQHEFGDGCILDTTARRFTIRGNHVELTPKEFDLLRCLLSSGGRAMTRERLLQDVWGSGLFVTHRSIDRCVKTLRAKLDSSAHQLETVRGVGYRWSS